MESENLADKFYKAFIGKVEDSELEIDNDEQVISKEESRARLDILQMTFSVFASVLILILIAILCRNGTSSVIVSGIPKTNIQNAINFIINYHLAGNDLPHLSKKVMLYHNGIVVEYDYNNTTIQTLPIKLYN